jgi:hypothetical protein
MGSEPPSNPDLLIVSATASVFRAEDRTDKRFYLLATLGSGLLRFEVVARLPDGAHRAVKGKDFFRAMMDHFGAKVRIIEGEWDASGGLTANIQQLNAATARGLSLDEAAALTWTGRMAAQFGFKNLTVIDAVPAAAQDTYRHVRVNFTT